MSGAEEHAPQLRWPFWVAAGFLALDQLTKRWVLDNIALFEVREVIPGFFNLTYVRNTGAAFSLFQGHPQALSVFSIIVFGLIVVFRFKIFTERLAEQWAFALLMGGILGNLVDRMKYEYVIDFLDVYVGSYHWPSFNVADSCICVAVGIYLLSQHKAEKLAKEQAKEQA